MSSSSPDREDYGLNYRSFVGPEAIYDLVGASQFSLLTLLGLREHHTLLDIGCGSFRGGKLFLPYLAPGNYFGVEPNRWLIDEGIEKEIGQDQIDLKRPGFIHDADFTLTAFGRTFDYLIAQSIFSHASQRQIARCLSQARLVMTPDSLFAATFNVWKPETGREVNYSGDEWYYPGSVYYSLEWMTRVAEEHGLRCRRIGWPQPGGQTWVILTRPEWQGTIPPDRRPADASVSCGSCRPGAAANLPRSGPKPLEAGDRSSRQDGGRPNPWSSRADARQPARHAASRRLARGIKERDVPVGNI